MARKKSRKAKPLLTVKSGQTYKVHRPGKPAHHVRVTRIIGKTSHQPKIRYRLVTRSGKKKALGYGLDYLTCWLQWTGTTWSPPSTWELQA